MRNCLVFINIEALQVGFRRLARTVTDPAGRKRAMKAIGQMLAETENVDIEVESWLCAQHKIKLFLCLIFFC